MFGGCFLAYEGAHKVIHALRKDDHDHDVPAALQGPDAESKTISGAIRTDFILSAEIMVISLKEVLDEPIVLAGRDPGAGRACSSPCSSTAWWRSS